jgi:hypothetical protein
MTEAECTAAGLEYITADDLFIPYNDEAPDLGAFELDGIPHEYIIPEKIELTCTTANSSQEVVAGSAIPDIVYEVNSVATAAVVEGLSEGLTYLFDVANHQIVISGTPTSACTFKLTVSGNQEAGVKDVTTTGIITLITPFKVLTGDWYHFQDAFDALPTDLQGVVTLIQGDKAATTIDPTKTESGCAYSAGAVCLGQSNGGIKFTLDHGVLNLLLNTFFTGGRTFKIDYTMANGTTKSVTTEKFSRGSYQMDLLAIAGLSDESQTVNVRSITFAQSGANGGARIYDMYVRIPADAPTAITTLSADAAPRVVKILKDRRLIIMKGRQAYNALGMKQ